MFERVITAIVLVSVVLSCMFISEKPYPMLVLMVLAALGAGYEWFKLMPKTEEAPIRLHWAWLTGIITSVITLSVLIWLKELWVLFWLAAVAVWVVSVLWVTRYPRYDAWYNSSLLFLGLVLIVAAVTALFSLWQTSPWWLMYVFLLVWSADSGAYFVGRKLGMRKLAPAVSPNKSVEGLFGGVAVACLVMVAVAFSTLKLNFLGMVAFFILSIITVFASVLGDLFESMIKRRAGIKDSGRILPGHGGVLDRVDSLLAAAPIFAAGLYLFGVMGLDI